MRQNIKMIIKSIIGAALIATAAASIGLIYGAAHPDPAQETTAAQNR